MKKIKKNKQVKKDKKARKLTVLTLENLDQVTGGSCSGVGSGKCSADEISQ